MSLKQITMPKACCSCQNYTPKGFKEDEHCPFYDGVVYKTRKTRTRYGVCSKTKTDVFMTEICPNYKQEECIGVVEVENRPAPMQPHQVSFNLG
ncbi:hypothetical protein [Catenovulum sediminis]|uniref:Uncharacterized protein n=1 Tax=Catenovulum sediminis TaxID=1740262 RepID=A0ABV1RHK7_9ALTE